MRYMMQVTRYHGSGWTHPGTSDHSVLGNWFEAVVVVPTALSPAVGAAGMGALIRCGLLSWVALALSIKGFRARTEKPRNPSENRRSVLR
jgi:hypothetical protein